MANSKYEYVKSFEQPDTLLPNTWIVGSDADTLTYGDDVSILRLSDRYAFKKPNDRRALDLMNAAAVEVMKDLPDLAIAYGVSDEYRFVVRCSLLVARLLASASASLRTAVATDSILSSFVFHPSCELFERRSAKLVTTIVSTFTAHYIYLWGTYFTENPLQPPYLPSFDGRAVVYPAMGNLRDYMSWRQVDCHINNLYNTTFWTMVQQGGMSNTDAERELQGTVSSDKNEILFTRFGINYNNEDEMYKKGSVIYRQYQLEDAKPASNPSIEQDEGSSVPEAISKSQQEKLKKLRRKAQVVVNHVDIIKDEFWERRPWILSGRPGKLPEA
ncbi:tRNA(His) guanylyltransferase [Aspergillus ochraceoroseus]|uniref:tRNA(His) guanylyltransferase n=1 Tax=Aspergillus ochraceoroseus TaxID=138278 RepID=A0A0F8UQ09_9EURO|nr:tRNA(His) guanylyltransferase [Aspergillus ochraceoroseus]